MRQALTTLAAGRLAVEPSDVEIGYVEQAATPNNQSTGLFAGICAIVGILFTFNAMLLTVPERRRPRRRAAHAGLQAPPGAPAARVRGDSSSASSPRSWACCSATCSHATSSTPRPATSASRSRSAGSASWTTSSVLLALAGGIGATFVATTPLLRDLFSREPVDAAYRSSDEPGEAIDAHARARLALFGIGLLAGTILLVTLVPQATMLCIALLAVAMLALVPALLAGMLALVDRVIDGVRGSSLPLAVMELRGSLTRATALAATGALAVFGTVAIQGAHRDLLHGLDVTAASLLGTTDIWVTAAGDENILMTTPFKHPDRQALLATGAVSDVRAYRGEFLDMAGRRVWVMARPPTDRSLIPPTEVQEGNVGRATQQIRDGGWAAISASIADRLDVGVGDPFTIPTPVGPQKLRVAAIVSNLGWAPGSLVLNGDDYRRWWPGADVTALEVDLRPGVTPPPARQRSSTRCQPRRRCSSRPKRSESHASAGLSARA